MTKRLTIFLLATLLIVGAALIYAPYIQADCGSCKADKSAKAECKATCGADCKCACCEGNKDCAACCADKDCAKCCDAAKGCATCCADKKGCDKSAAASCSGDKPCSLPQSAQSSDVSISTGVLAALIRAEIPVTILDARTGKYDDGKRIAFAKVLAPDASVRDAAAVIKSKDSLVIAYCGGTTCPLAPKLAENLQSLGYRNVIVYSEGISGWIAAGNPVKEHNKRVSAATTQGEHVH
ncbi:MAG TPA: rhodanese-like domain-containing protein [bacterium]|nr:rhodanese-like domain-containing protein [bacterium]